MHPLESDTGRGRRVLSEAIRAVRKRRRLKVGDVAQRMDLARRSYEYFEAEGSLDLTRLQRFAEVTRSDAYAILLSIPLGSPQFAARCADNKMMTTFLTLAREFDLRLGDDIARLGTESITRAFATAFRDLESLARGDGKA
ncbi:MAG: XRE family transcriptional regulator [Phenylobacterium sp.]|uniref:XRE family transcriptional regulator n=1 Tax=Phenylobacterium sp. TaxID=1871053 RepID=UPI002736F0AF|nr:XRE family transcriptional regulator [Phenylobacterium sp.]MDP3749290.1 XRE family transcriptional regulator [Phenylobacterium sp.]